VFKRLIEAGASVCDAGARGETVLHVATIQGYTSLIEPLIEMGADIGALDVDGWTPVHHATEAENMEILEILLKHAKNGDSSKTRAAPIVMAPGNADLSRVLGSHINALVMPP